MSSRVVQAPIQLTKYDRTTNGAENVLGIICPSMPITDVTSSIVRERQPSKMREVVAALVAVIE
jgi:hypothetical protein